MIDRRKMLQSALMALATGGTLGRAGTTMAKRLGPLSHECVFPVQAFAKEVPRVDKGFLISRLSKPQVRGGLRNLAVYSRTGELAYDVNLAIPESHQTSIADVALTPEGRVVVAAAAVDPSGRVARVIATLTESGSVSQLVHTNPFQAHHVRCSEDGEIWALGREFPEPEGDFTPHELVHKYSSDGHLMQKFLLAETKPYGAMLATSGPMLAFGASGNAVRLYVARLAQYIEGTEEGELVAAGHVETPTGSSYPDSPRGLAVTESGALFGLFRQGDNKALYQLNGSAMAWEQVPGTLAERRNTDMHRLCGADGEALVFRTREPNRLIWRDVIA